MLPPSIFFLASLQVLVDFAIASPMHSKTRGTSSSCAKSLPVHQMAGGNYTSMNITSSGVERSYLITIPALYATRSTVPVIFSFHGGTRSASDQWALSQMSNPDYNDFAIAIYPQGLETTPGNANTTSWEGVPKATGNDTQFVTDIIAQLEFLYCIDTSRIWATGKSDGGGLCNVLACDPKMSLVFAAFAPVSAAFYIDNTTTCSPNHITIPCHNSRTVPIMEFHGGNDTTIKYKGGGRKKECLPSIPHWVHEWAARDGLPATNVTSSLTNDTLLYVYGSGKQSGLVQHVFDATIGHDWPSTVPNLDNSQQWHNVATFNATPIILEWFKKHTL